RRRGKGGVDVRSAGVDPRRRPAHRAPDDRRPRRVAERRRATRRRARARHGGRRTRGRRRRRRALGREPGRGAHPVRGARDRRPRPAPGAQPVGRAALRPSDHDDRPRPARRGVPTARGTRRRAGGPEGTPRDRTRDAGALPATERVLRPRGRAEACVKRPVAVVGVGQTHHASRRSDVSIPGLVREAVDRALLDAGLDYGDIDAVVVGKAPDQLEGVMQPEQFLAGALGAHLKPLVRVPAAGSVGASTALTAATHVGSGLFERVLAVAFEKQSEGNAMWALSPNLPFTPPLVAGAGGFFAPFCRAYIART